MKKTICKKLYDTDTSTLLKKVTSGEFGDTEGYEESLYMTQEGSLFIYTNGGRESKYPKEGIKRMSRAAADKWLSES